MSAMADAFDQLDPHDDPDADLVRVVNALARFADDRRHGRDLKVSRAALNDAVAALEGWGVRVGAVTAVAVCFGAVEAARRFLDMPGATERADAWADGFRAGADAFNGHERAVYVLPRDAADFERLVGKVDL